jgi:hypothetical protein
MRKKDHVARQPGRVPAFVPIPFACKEKRLPLKASEAKELRREVPGRLGTHPVPPIFHYSLQAAICRWNRLFGLTKIGMRINMLVLNRRLGLPGVSGRLCQCVTV